MPVRNWDKARRQDKAQGGYRSLSGLDYSRPKPRKKRRGHGWMNAKAAQKSYYNALANQKTSLRVIQRRARPNPPPTTISSPPRTTAATRWLQVELGDSIATAVFVRRSGSTRWRCTAADHPAIHWFRGMLHMEPIARWLKSQRHPFRWSSTNPRQTVTNNCHDEAPVEPSKATQAQASDTDPSLKNPIPTLPGIPASRLKGGLAQTGVTTSLLHPTNPST